MRLADRAVIEVSQRVSLLEQVKEVGEEIWANQWTQVVAWLTAASLMDLLLAPGGAGRLLYLVPAWLMAERHSKGIAYVAVLAGLVMHHVFGRGAESAALIGMLMQALLGAAIVIRIDGHLQSAAKYAHLASIDPLTGLMNRKALDAYTVKEIERCVQEQKPFTLAVIDCDKFKQLNDMYGHAHGDEVLRLLAKNVVHQLGGKRCRLGRTGGDEFVAVLPGVPLGEAQARLHRAAEAFGDATLIKGAKSTISVGFATSADSGYGLSRLLKDADDDMYRRKAAKNGGAAFGLPV